METLVVSFGSSSSGAAVFELDGPSHLDDDGNERSAIYPDEQGILRLHYDHTAYRVTRVVPVRGSIVALGAVLRTITQEVYFSEDDESQTLSYLPSGGVMPQYVGRQGQGLEVSGREVWITSGAPCQATLTYQARFVLYRYTPPGLSLDQGESVAVNVEAYLEAL